MGQRLQGVAHRQAVQPRRRYGGTLGNFPEAVKECFRHMGVSNTCWLDGHVSGIKDAMGEDVPQCCCTGTHASP